MSEKLAFIGMNNKIKLFGIFGVGLILASCIEHRPKNDQESTNQFEKKIYSTEVAQSSNIRIFEGRVPCESCDGIQQKLILKGDSSGIFRMTETYKKPENETETSLVFNGQWKFDKRNNKQVIILSQGTLKDSIRRMVFATGANSITLIVQDNETINSSRYILHKQTRKKKIKA